MSSSDTLASLNSAALGADMPVVTLPTGQKVQTGTVATLLINIKKYDALAAQAETANGQEKVEFDTQIKDIEHFFLAAMPLLHKVGMFDLFIPDEWIAGTRSAGRRRVGELAKAMVEENK
ncbi:hypothetical protein H2198_003064 [Neophaeococcomyces mojaviensis]|uniref:Uncharacterized protein n=1 Tax=Neophaeococcomyces mojaviensis TaxID=3383035 RepID=A0ACC3ACB2_9EURO|nr:hypothetical protein H2198_003064 [Knufia sp. JES_112]